VVVVGHVYTSEYEDREGNRRSSVEVRAISVGPDLARCVVRIEHPKRSTEDSTEESTEDHTAEPAAAIESEPTDDEDDDGGALPLSA
jgi:single-strand DNA-binding protein